MKTGELKVIYKNSNNGIDVELDMAIEAALEQLGYKRWASGCNICTGERDLAFERKGKEDHDLPMDTKENTV